MTQANPAEYKVHLHPYRADTQQIAVAGEVVREPNAAEQTLQFVGNHADGPRAIREQALSVHSAVGSEAAAILEMSAFTGQQIEGQIGAIETQASAVIPTKTRAEATASYLQQLLSNLPPEASAVPNGTVPLDYKGHEIDYSSNIATLEGRTANIVAQLVNLQHMSTSAVRDSNEQLTGMTTHVARLRGELNEVQAIHQETGRQETGLIALYNAPGGARELGEKIDELATQLEKMAYDYEAKRTERAIITTDLRQSEERYFVLKADVSDAYNTSQTKTAEFDQRLQAELLPPQERTEDKITQLISEYENAQGMAMMTRDRFAALYRELQQIDEVRGPKEARVGTLIVEMKQTEAQAGELYIYAQQLAWALKEQIRHVAPIKRNLDALRKRLEAVEQRVLPDATAEQQTQTIQTVHNLDVPRFGPK